MYFDRHIVKQNIVNYNFPKDNDYDLSTVYLKNVYIIEDTNYKIKLLNIVAKIVKNAFFVKVPKLFLQLITVKLDGY